MVDQNTGEEQVCEERDGWCVPGTKDKLRDMISGMIKKMIRAQKPGRLKKEKINIYSIYIIYINAVGS